MPSVKLYYFAISAPARSCYWYCLLNDPEQKDVELIVVDVTKKEQHKPEFLALNPYHTVPVLKDESNGLVLNESGAILQYLSEKFPHWTNVSLPSMEKDAVTRFKAINYLHFHHNRVRNGICKAHFGRFGHLLGIGTGVDNDAIKAAITAAQDWLPKFDKMIAENGGYIAGKEPTIADLQCFAELSFFLTDKHGLDLYNFKPYENIRAWIEKMKAVPKHDEVYDNVLDFVKICNDAAPSSCCDDM